MQKQKKKKAETQRTSCSGLEKVDEPVYVFIYSAAESLDYLFGVSLNSTCVLQNVVNSDLLNG